MSDDTKKIKIMMVEDELLFAGLIGEYLKKCGFEIGEIVSDGDEAFEKIKAYSPDLILMDVRIEGSKDGIEVAKQIFDELKIPVIFLTAYSDVKSIERAKAAYPFGYFVKPIDERQLYVAIRFAIEKHRQELHLYRQEEEQEESRQKGEIEFSVKVKPGSEFPDISDEKILEVMKKYGKEIARELSGMKKTNHETGFESFNKVMKEKSVANLKNNGLSSGNRDFYTPRYLINEATKLTSVEPNVIRKYEKQGLLKPYRQPKDNFRRFTQDEVEWIKTIWNLIHEKGMSIEGILRIIMANKCWEYFNCKEEDRNECEIFGSGKYPCWKLSAMRKKCKHGNCYECDFYIMSRRNPILFE